MHILIVKIVVVVFAILNGADCFGSIRTNTPIERAFVGRPFARSHIGRCNCCIQRIEAKVGSLFGRAIGRIAHALFAAIVGQK